MWSITNKWTVNAEHYSKLTGFGPTAASTGERRGY